MKLTNFSILLLFVLSGCSSIQTFKLDRNYSDDLKDRDRLILERKLAVVKELLYNECTESRHVFAISGEYLTIKLRSRCRKNLDSIFYYTLCDRYSPKDCGLLVKKHF